ncbi:hypothetical protein [Novispirillum itersonii]|uniref:Uncharacterized protein n=1 Tax=Novispirillum itersonii TaxID=189 RepID=A0A7W9ZGS2_NOVIT|nr:hypothetical protein [Novispirillum itersonii]MBB6209984.1 hypothetical protein [Novispirillum itersonii]
MATTAAQTRWRNRNRFSKKQLNVMARLETHQALEDIASAFALRGKAEAVTFSCFVLRWLMQQQDLNEEARRLLALLTESYHNDRDIYAP